MKRISALCAIAIAFSAHATDLPPGMPDIKPLTGDDEWACTVLLCLANPNGAKSVQECVPPIDRLIDHLRKGGKIPRCPQAGEGNYVDFGSGHYNPCDSASRDEKLKPVTGWVAEKGKAARYAYPDGRRKVSNNDLNGGWRWEYTGLACAKTPAIDTRFESYWDGASHKYRRVSIYPKLVWEEPQGFNFDVFVNGELWQRVDVY